MVSQVASELIAGTGGGIVGTLAGHPFDTVKVRLQAMPSMQREWFLTCISRSVREEGIASLYKGVLSPVGMCGVLTAITFATEKSTERFLAARDVPAQMTSFAAGCVGGLAQCPATCFMEAAKCNLQVIDNKKFNFGAYAATFRKRVLALGVRQAFLPALGVTIVREVPSYGVYFLTYDTVKAKLEAAIPGTPAVLLAGGMAGVVALTPFHPLDVVKSRLQISTDPSATALSIFRESCRNEGLRFMFKGFLPFICRTFLLNAGTFYGFEQMLKLMQA